MRNPLTAIKNVLTFLSSVASDDNLWRSSSVAVGKSTTSGQNISPQSALTITTYYNCIRNIAEDIGKLPLCLYRHVSRGKEDAKDHPLYSVLHDDPNPEMAANSFIEVMISWAVGWGNAYAEIIRDGGGRVRELWPIHPQRVRAKRTPAGVLYYEVTNDQGETRPILPSRMLHVHGLGWDGICGYSPAYLAAECLGLAKAAQNYAASFFGNGTNVGGVLSTDKVLSPEARKALAQSWNDAYQGSQNANKTAVVDSGLEFDRIDMPLADAQFLETRQYGKEEIAGMFRMPLSKLIDSKRAQGWSTLDAQNTDYATDCLMSWAVRLEKEMERKLLTKEERVEYFAEVDFRKLLRGDAVARMQYNRERMNTASITPNEIRKEEGDNPIDDPAADKVYIMTNMATLDSVAAGSTKPKPGGGAPPAPAAPPPADDNADARLLPLFFDAADRAIRKEVMATERAAGKYEVASDFAQWLTRFQAEQRQCMLDGFASVIHVMERPGTAAQLLIESYLQENFKRLNSAFVNGRCDAALKDIAAGAAGFASSVFEATKGETKHAA